MKKFKLTIIGSGTMMPTKKRHPACYLVEVGAKKILLDIGHTSLARLVEMGIDLQSIDTVFISHFHTDHFSDLLPLVHARRVDDAHYPERKPQPLTIISPQSITARWKKLREVFWAESLEDYPIKFIKGVQTITVGDVQIELFEVKHVQWYQSLGIKISYQNKALVYTGDIGSQHPLQQLKSVVKNIDLLLIEASYLDPTPNHFTIDQVIEIANSCSVKQTIATHIRESLVPTVKEKIKNQNKIIVAQDLEEIIL